MSLHNKIMNIECDTKEILGINLILAYKSGHRSARHAAAELVLKTDTEINKLKSALEKIAALDPSEDSSEGYNEWGEADCFNQAQKIANEVLK